MKRTSSNSIFPNIKKVKFMGNPSAVIRGTRIPVYVLIGYFLVGETPETIVEEVLPQLTLPQVYEAMRYYFVHRAEIDQEREDHQDELRKIFATRRNKRLKKFALPKKKILAFCKRWNVTEFSLFGSVLRDDFRLDSDVDVLVSIDPAVSIGLFEVVDMKLELEKLFKRSVDLVEKEGLRNPYRRKEILRTAQVIYAAQ